MPDWINIEWHDFQTYPPIRVDWWHLVRDTSGNIYVDKWIYSPFVNCFGNVVEYRWLNTHSAYVEKWASTDGISLAEYCFLVEGED